jgi:hypothetical protein
MAIVSAAGYPQYSGSLVHPVVSARVLERVYETAITPSIADTSWFGEINNVGDQVTFFRNPTAVVRRSTKGGNIRHDTIDSSPITITIDHALEASLKVDPLDKRMVKNWASLEAGYREDLARQIEGVIDDHFLSTLYTGNNIAPENKGLTAGVISGNINLGAPGAPVVLTPGNILDFMMHVELVFRERNVDIYRETPWMVGPPVLNTTLMTSDLKSALFSGLDRATVLMNGRIADRPIAGFDVMLTNKAPRVFDVARGKWCYHILFGLKKATAFAFNNAQARTIEDVNDWMSYTQSRYVYGLGTLYPEFLVDAYVTFDAT